MRSAFSIPPMRCSSPGVPGTAYEYRTPPFVPDVETNADSAKLDCAGLAPIERTFGAHSAPLGLAFTDRLPPPYSSGALVGVHGSWNRTPPQAPDYGDLRCLGDTGTSTRHDTPTI